MEDSDIATMHGRIRDYLGGYPEPVGIKLPPHWMSSFESARRRGVVSGWQHQGDFWNLREIVARPDVRLHHEAKLSYEDGSIATVPLY